MGLVKAAALGVALWFVAIGALAQDLTQYADPFVGSSGGGNTVPGAAVPFGFINLSPDTTHGDTNGYDNWSPIAGFSYTHVSGTGGASKYGNFRTTPTVGPVNPRRFAYGRHDEAAAPGLYKVRIGNTPDQQIGVELTASRLVGIQRITFPKDQTGNVLIDVTSAVQLGGGGPHATAAHVETHADGTISGWASLKAAGIPRPISSISMPSSTVSLLRLACGPARKVYPTFCPAHGRSMAAINARASPIASAPMPVSMTPRWK